MGTSMGAMHAWMWGYMFPAFADGLVPLASNPVEIAGRNRVWRKLLVDAIVTDPTWKGGNYTEPPRGMASALGFLLLATSVPLQWQKDQPTAAAADRWLADQIAARLKTTDANDTIYHFRASEDFDPSAHLREITTPLLAINSADDFVNPPELPMMQALMGKVTRGKFVLVPISDETRGHGTHSRPQVFGPVPGRVPQALALDKPLSARCNSAAAARAWRLAARARGRLQVTRTRRRKEKARRMNRRARLCELRAWLVLASPRT